MGWDRQDRTYFVLDDNRVYRLSEPVQPPPSRKRTKTSRRALRVSKRRNSPNTGNMAGRDNTEAISSNAGSSNGPEDDDGLGGMKWECLAVTLDEVRGVVASFQNTRDENEKVLRDRLQEHLVPILAKQEESRKRKALQRQKELDNLAKMANAKRSSRLAIKQERLRLEEQAREEEQRQLAEEEEARKAEEACRKLERERELRLMSREKRINEREARRRRYEEELSNLSEDSRRDGRGTGRMSKRRLQTEIEKNQRALKQLEDDEAEDDWMFDCECGAYGRVDDGTHSISCERCNVWQHSKCVGVLAAEAEQPRFHFVCSACRRREETANSKPRPTIKLKVNRPVGAASEPSHDSQFRTPLGVSFPNSDGESAVGSRLGQTESATTCKGAPNANSAPNGHERVDSQNEDEPVGTQGTATDTRTESFASSDSPHRSSSRDGRRSNGTQHQDAGLGLTPASSVGKLDGAPYTSRDARLTQEQTRTDASADVKPPEANRSPHKASQRGDSVVTSSPSARSNKSISAAPCLNQQVRGEAGSTEPGILPPSSAGHSPAKQSPTWQCSSSASVKSSSMLPIYPPTTTLAPLDQHLILTPPTKQANGPRQPQVPGKMELS